MAFHQGEVYLSHDFYGQEEHLVLIVSTQEFNRGKYVSTAMFTSQRLDERWTKPNCVQFRASEFDWLERDSVLQAESVSQMPWRFLDLQRGAIARIGDAKLSEVVAAIGVVMNAACHLTLE